MLETGVFPALPEGKFVLRRQISGGERWGVKVGVNKTTIRKIPELIQADSGITIDELALKTGISDRAIKKNLFRLKKKGLLKRAGVGKLLDKERGERGKESRCLQCRHTGVAAACPENPFGVFRKETKIRV